MCNITYIILVYLHVFNYTFFQGCGQSNAAWMRRIILGKTWRVQGRRRRHSLCFNLGHGKLVLSRGEQTDISILTNWEEERRICSAVLLTHSVFESEHWEVFTDYSGYKTQCFDLLVALDNNPTSKTNPLLAQPWQTSHGERETIGRVYMYACVWQRIGTKVENLFWCALCCPHPVVDSLLDRWSDHPVVKRCRRLIILTIDWYYKDWGM